MVNKDTATMPLFGKDSMRFTTLSFYTTRSFFPLGRMARGFFPLLSGMLLLAGCAPSHVFHTAEDVSRDFTYITFSQNSAPFQHASQVGGEHMSFIKVLGFEGEIYVVELTCKEGRCDYHISGDGVLIEKDPAGPDSRTVTVLARDALFSVAVSAHPYGDYALKITKR